MSIDLAQAASEKGIGFVDAFHTTEQLLSAADRQYTINGVHLNEAGYAEFANVLYRGLFQETPPEINDSIRRINIDKNQQFFRRYRPLNTFYYTGGRRKDYGYLDFLPAMQRFETMVENR